MCSSDLVRAERFRVHAVDTVDQAIELLTGLEAGAADEAGDFPAATFNGRVQAGLERLVQVGLELGEREAAHVQHRGRTAKQHS